MREILFRGKQLYTCDWVEGTGIFNDGLNTWISFNEPNKPIAYGMKHRMVYTETVGQFTGLTDKNGKKIFEGDILSIAKIMDGFGTYYFPPIAYPGNVVVKWGMCAWMWETLGEYRFFINFPDAWCHFECEVIGNIHDNPELLEVEDGN